MKLCTLVAIVCVIFSATLLASSGATNSTWGHVGRYDFVLHRQVVVASDSWMRVVTRDVSYPPRGYVNYYNITAIKAIDHDRKHGGYASLYSGGIGRRNVTVHLASQRGYGLNFTVEIYGH